MRSAKDSVVVVVVVANAVLNIAVAVAFVVVFVDQFGEIKSCGVAMQMTT